MCVDGVRYSVPPNMLGQLVEIRRCVDSDVFEIRWAGTTVARHRQADSDVADVWAHDHRSAAVAEALRGHDRRPQRHLRAVNDDAAAEAARLDLGVGDFDIEAPNLADRYAIDDAKALP